VEARGLITTKFTKKASPLMAVLAILAVSISLVGATVILTSNTAQVSGTHIMNNQGAIVISLGTTAPATHGTYYSTDNAGINYGMSANIPMELTTATIKVVITEKDAVTNPSWSDIGSVTIVPTTPGYPTYTLIGTGSTNYVPTVSYASLTYTITITGPIPQGTALEGNLNIVYNIPGTFDVAASMTGIPNA
jgi:hypothetical protein